MKLDFTLETAKERSDSLIDIDSNVSERELEMYADYIMWGKFKPGSKDSPVSTGQVLDPSKNKTWRRTKDESLEAMSENEGSQPEIQHSMYANAFGEPLERPHYVLRKTPKFSRKVTRKTLQERNLLDLLEDYEELWLEIDKLDLMVAHWEIIRGRRKTVKELRPALLKRLTPALISECKRKAEHFSEHEGLRHKRELVRLRTRQFEMRDLFSPTILNAPYVRASASASATTPHEILPLGGCGSFKVGKLIFFEKITKEHFESPLILRHLMYYDKVDKSDSYDFCNQEHIALLVYELRNIYDETFVENLERQEHFKSLWNAFFYYFKRANLKDFQRAIVILKAVDATNSDIVEHLKTHYGKKYRENYISTIFRSQCCREIAKAAQLHYEQIEGILLGEEAFKRCNTCGSLKLKSADFFVRRKNSADGFTNRCKECSRKIKEAKAKNGN